MSPVGDTHFYAKKKNGVEIMAFRVAFMVFILWCSGCLSILAPSAPILLRSSSFLRRSIAEIHRYRSRQKRAPTLSVDLEL